jgi:diguanylate cyclase (GGDEF)-like protein/PAS domain S-box-containing protein
MKTDPYMAISNVIDLLPDAICVVDASGRFVFVSSACERIFGYTPEEMIGNAMIDLVFPEDREKTLLAANEIMAGNLTPHFENRYVRKDGRLVHIMWSARWSDADQMRIAVARDITERKRAEAVQAALYSISEAAHSADNLPDLFQKIHQVIAELLPTRNFSVALYDIKEDELSFPYYVDEYNETPEKQKLDSGTLSGKVIRSGETLLLTPDSSKDPDQWHPIETTAPLYWLGVPLKSHTGIIGALVVRSYSEGTRYTETDKELLQFVSTQVATAIERKQLQTRLQYIAQYDPLTDLPNRELLYDRLGTALARARREESGLSLFYLDLDKFKLVNDNISHAAGDLLLRQVAQRLKKNLRETDTVARIGGDEFVVLLEKVQSLEHVNAIAEKLRTALNQPFDLEGTSMHILPSIGIAIYPQHGDEEQQLIRNADEAMYVAKREGGNRCQISTKNKHQPK